MEHANTLGTTLVVITDQPHPSNWVGREAEPVLPSGVAAAVRLALGEGSTPTAPGSSFHLDQSTGFMPSSRAGVESAHPSRTSIRARP